MTEQHDTSTRPAFRLAMQLKVRDLSEAAWQLTNQIGFKSERAYQNVRDLPADCRQVRMRRLNQIIEVVKAGEGEELGVGNIDHVALETFDLDAAVLAVKAKWGALDQDITPDGPVLLPQFWDNGANFVFVLGPHAARIELCNKVGADPSRMRDRVVNIGPHDHVGIQSPDLPASRAFYEKLGMSLVGDFAIPTPDGDIKVNFLKRGDFMVELFSTPQARAGEAEFSQNPVWSALIFEFEGHGNADEVLTGAAGERVELRPIAGADEFTFDAEDL